MTAMTHVSAVTSRQGEGPWRPDVALSTNTQLVQLVAASGLSPAVAMTIFNRGRGGAACTESQWKGFLAEPGMLRYLELSADQFAHAVHQFARIGVHREWD